ncbi:MAG: arylsulfatase [Acidimicrobiales bacterium]
MTHPGEPHFGGTIATSVADSTAWWPEANRPPAGSPNVVVVVLDDVGFADLGCYGSEIDTPTIDRLADGGLRYTGFHTTPLCSPTRACLLTGRNHHSVGMSMVAEWDAGFPAARSRITPAAATIAQVLRDAGYATLHVGKWHLAPPHEQTQVGPFHNWPLGKGFERSYGFLSGYTDQFPPDLVQDNEVVLPPRTPAEGYHLTEDLIDHADRFVRDHLALAPDRPFFLYLALGACHWPLQAPAELVAKYRGRYDRGWDEVRAERFDRQQALGVVPQSAGLPPRNEGVSAWDDLSDDERRFAARLQEAYAGFLDHADAQLARLVDTLTELGQLDDTLIVLLSDNGASQEGGPSGYLNISQLFNGLRTDVEAAMPRLDEIGGPSVQPAYPLGWAQVSNTPLKRYKGNTHGGGVRDPLIVHWPARVTDAGAIRPQFHHAIDVTPTLLEVLGLEAPSTYAGVEQMPVHGTSFAYTFAEAGARAPTRHVTQHFEMGGHRAMWHDGWKAVTYHPFASPYEDDVWELYHVDEDYSELHDLAEARPDKLAELVERWWAAADEFGVLPLDDRMVERLGLLSPPGSPRQIDSFRLPPGVRRIPPIGVPFVPSRSYAIEADVECTDGDEGVLISHGGVGGGNVLYVRGGRLVLEYDQGDVRRSVTSDRPVPEGSSVLGFRFDKSAVLRGTAVLMIDGEPVGSIEITRTLGVVPATGAFEIGADSSSPSSPHYPAPFRFTGTIGEVRVDLGDDIAPVTVWDLIAD